MVYLNRTVPQVEVEAVSQFLHHLLTGDVDKLPTETLVHTFWTWNKEQKQTAKYLACLRKHMLTQVKCYLKIGNYCGMQFGHKWPERIEQCRRLLANEINATTAGIVISTSSWRKLYRTIAESDHRSSVAGDEGRTCDNGLDETAAERTAQPARHSPRPRPTRRSFITQSLWRQRSRRLHEEYPEARVYNCRWSLAILSSRDRRHPVSPGTGAWVSRSHNVGQIRGHCLQPRAEISRHLQITRRAAAERYTRRDAEESREWESEEFDDKMAK